MAIIAILPEEKKYKQFPVAENEASNVHEALSSAAAYPSAKTEPWAFPRPQTEQLPSISRQIRARRTSFLTAVESRTLRVSSPWQERSDMSPHAPRWRTSSASSSKANLCPGATGPRFEPFVFSSSFADNLRDCLKPSPRGAPSPEPGDLAARWKTGSRGLWQSQALSLAIYCGGLALIFFTISKPHANAPETPPVITTLIAPDSSEYARRLPAGGDLAQGGGGGGKRSALPVTTGKAPKFTLVQLAPPSRPQNIPSTLVADASLLGDPAVQFPSPNLSGYGDPLSGLMNDSDGTGRGGGMGDGQGTGLGSGFGPGLGPGRDGGVGGKTFQAGRSGVGFPSCAYCPDAKYSEDARRAKFQGVVVLQIVVTADGHADDIEIVSGPGLGLEEEAIKAVKTWRFQAALGPGRKPVATRIAIEVQFRLL
jgi:protein TonB